VAAAERTIRRSGGGLGEGDEVKGLKWFQSINWKKK
jgi:hypothetical protein